MPLRRGKIAPMRPLRQQAAGPSVCSVALTLPLLLSIPLSLFAVATDSPSIEQADGLWRQRARGQSDGEPDPVPIRRALAAYEALLTERPDDLEVRWKLLRAQQFYGEYVLEEADEKRQLFRRARDLADDSRRRLLERHGLTEGEASEESIVRALSGETGDGDTLAAAIYYYSAVHWGRWGDTTGRLSAARAGVGDKLRDFGRLVVALDERFEEAAGHRLLGRLHTEAPRIPLVTGWVDRDLAVRELETACRIAPQNPFNQTYLADALLRFRNGRRAEAIERLERVVTSEPRQSQLVEDLAAIDEARRLLAEER